MFFSSVQFSHSVVSDSLRPHEPQHAWPPCPSPTSRVHPNPCPLSQWCHPVILCSVVPFSSCPQSFPTSGSFKMSQLFASDGQSTEVSASTSVLPMTTQDRSPLGWTGCMSLQGDLFMLSQIQMRMSKRKKWIILINIKKLIFKRPYSVQFSSVTQLCPLWPHEHSTPGLPVHHQLPESTQTQAQWVS